MHEFITMKVFLMIIWVEFCFFFFFLFRGRLKLSHLDYNLHYNISISFKSKGRLKKNRNNLSNLPKILSRFTFMILLNSQCSLSKFEIIYVLS